ncbi:MAG: hypothetical protein JRL30_29250 [Deltaproteobacteria bacterium]|nr:hypothetical protein [Deltaproteobacteria bacterium]
MVDILDTVGGTGLAIFAGNEKLEDAVILRVDGKIYDSWEDVSISRSMENMSSSFSISMADRWREEADSWPLAPGKLLRVNIGDKPVINGYIDSLEAAIQGGDRSLSIDGRDKTADLIDCSAIGTAELKNVTIEDIARHFATELFGINVVVETDVGEKFKTWTINQGETVFETLQRAARIRGVLLLSNTDGELVITNRASNEAELPSTKSLTATFDFVAAASSKLGIKSTGVDLIQGQNVIDASASYDQSDRYSDYLVVGQAAGDDDFFGAKANQVEAASKDLGINRFRPVKFIAETNVDTKGAQKKANWEASVRAAQSVDISVTVQGWLEKPGGDLWAPNKLVRVEIPFVGIKGTLLISGVTYRKGSSGTFTDISLTRSDAFTPDLAEIPKQKADELGWLSEALRNG